MADLTISSAALLTGATIATGDLIPVLDVSASAGSKGSRITLAELFTGRSLTGLTGLAIRSTGAAFDLTLASAEALTAGRTLTFNVGNAARTLTIPASGTVALLGTANVFTAAQSVLVSLTGSQATSSLDLSSVWNTSGGPALLYGVVTNTASASAAQLINLRGSVTNSGAVSVRTDGYMCLEGPSASLGFSFGQGLSSSNNFNQYGLVLASDSTITFRSGGTGTAQDTIISRKAAASLQLGTTHATTPTAQSLWAHSVTTGTGASLTLKGGTGTSAVGAAIVLGGGISTTTGGSLLFQTAATTTLTTLIQLSVGTSIGFYGATPVVQPAAVADVGAGAVAQVAAGATECRDQINLILARLRALGLIAT